MIEAKQVFKHFGEIEAVAGVDLEVKAGELFGLIGHNGAGKSTLFKMMLGLVPVSAGEIRIDGQPAHGEGFRRVRRHLGYLPENLVLYDNLSGLETLNFFARLKGIESKGSNTHSALLEQVGLAHAANRRVRGYSKGMKQRLGFAQALLGEPKLLFLDEPTNGLDPEGIREFYQILAGLQKKGVTILLTSHILSEIQERVDRLAIMKTGRIQATGTVHSLRESMALPLRLVARFPAEAKHEIETAMAAVAGTKLVINGERVLVDCPRAAKIAAIQALLGLSIPALDLQVHEPTLEEVFLGYSLSHAH